MRSLMVCPPDKNLIRAITFRRMRLAGHVARMGQKRNAYRILLGKTYRKATIWYGTIISVKRKYIIHVYSVLYFPQDASDNTKLSSMHLHYISLPVSTIFHILFIIKLWSYIISHILLYRVGGK